MRADVIRRQHKAWATEESYISWLRRYMTALPKMPKGLSSEQKIERFLTDLAYQGHLGQQPKPDL